MRARPSPSRGDRVQAPLRQSRQSVVRTGAVARLQRYRWLVYRALLGLVLIVSAIVAADVALGQPQGVGGLAFTIAYGACGSVLATILVSLTQVWFRLREMLAQGNEAIRVLGIRPDKHCRVAIVVTAWETGKWREQEPVGADGKLGPHKDYPDGLDDAIYVRRDVLLVADLIRLTQKAGLDAPLIVSDRELLDQVRAHSRERHLQVYTGDKNWVPVTDVVVVGLWGNRVTRKLSDAPQVPFRLVTKQGLQHLKLDPSDDNDRSRPTTFEPQDDERREGGQHRSTTTGFALVARFRFSALHT